MGRDSYSYNKISQEEDDEDLDDVSSHDNYHDIYDDIYADSHSDDDKLQESVISNHEKKRVADGILAASKIFTDIPGEDEEVTLEQRHEVIEQKKNDTREWFENFFKSKVTDSENIEISKRDFLKIDEVLEEFSMHFFRLFDSDDSGDVSIEEIKVALNKLSDAGEADKKTIKWFCKRINSKSEDGNITQDVFYKSINKEFLIRLFGMLDIDNSGTVNLDEFNRSVDRLLMMGSDEKILLYLENKFHEIATDVDNITYEDFKNVVKNKEEYFTRKMFNYCDKDKSRTISLQEFTTALERLMKKAGNEEEQRIIDEDKLHFLFEIYDQDGNGTIDRKEMRSCIKVCTLESSLVFKDDDEINRIADMLFDKADADGNGDITFDEFRNTLMPLIQNLEINPKGWVIPEKRKNFRDNFKNFRKRYLNKKWYVNNAVLLCNLFAVIFLHVIVFIIGIIFYRDSHPALMIAKGAGKCLNLSSVLCFILMCRTTLTHIRNSPVGRFLALDQSVDAHKALGCVYAVLALIHTAAHAFTFLNYTKTSLKLNDEGLNVTDWSFIWTTGGYWGGSYISGVVLILTTITLLIFASPKVRRGGHFAVFYWAHLINYTMLAIGTIVHCKNHWKWMCVPLAIYLVEKIAETRIIKKALYGTFYIIDYKVIPEDVVELTISRPRETFNFVTGSYAFLTIPFITRYEKHPFTISSSSENKHFITFHIKKEKGWTFKLYNVLNEDDKLRKEKRKQLKESQLNGDGKKPPFWIWNFGNFKKSQLEVLIDGPYGTPASEIFNSEHAVLIAAGIGVTPFASILQTIVDKFDQSCCICESCGHRNDLRTFNTKIRKLDFVWITRDQKSLQWFLELLKDLEERLEKYEKFAERLNTERKTKSARRGIRYRKKKKSEEVEEVPEDGIPLTPRSDGGEGETGEITKTVEINHGQFLEFHIYLTSALSKKDYRAVGLQYALQLLKNNDNKDAITGLKAQTNTGRPDWDELFDKISEDKRGKITVFFCGSPIIEEHLKVQCEKRRYKFKPEKF